MQNNLDLAICGGMVLLDDGSICRKTIAVKNGKIYGIFAPEETIDAKTIIDAQDLTVLPGMIDSHVHFKDPSPDSEKLENFVTGTRASASGGITMIMEMPNSFPCTYNKELFEKRKQFLFGRAFIDYGLYGATGHGHFDKVHELAEAGIVSFKSFLHAPPKLTESSWEGFCIPEESDMYQAFEQIQKTGKPIALHCEDNRLLDYMTEKVRAERTSCSYRDLINSRTILVELLAIQKAILFSEYFNVPIICCHVSSPEALELIREAKRRGVQVYAETCPHYLIFDEGIIAEHGSFGKCNPPVRDRLRVDRMWDYVLDGTVDIVSSDHSPHIREKKGVKDILDAPGGFPGTELLLPMMLDQVNKGKLSLAKLAELMSRNPAKIFGVLQQKGGIHPGADADFSIVDMRKEKTVDKNSLMSVAATAGDIYDGLRLCGWPVYTIVRGCVVMRCGQIDEGCLGHGRNVVPS